MLMHAHAIYVSARLQDCKPPRIHHGNEMIGSSQTNPPMKLHLAGCVAGCLHLLIAHRERVHTICEATVKPETVRQHLYSRSHPRRHRTIGGKHNRPRLPHQFKDIIYSICQKIKTSRHLFKAVRARISSIIHGYLISLVENHLLELRKKII